MPTSSGQSLLASKSAQRWEKIRTFTGHSFLFAVTAASAMGILFIIAFIFKDAMPFFSAQGITAIFEGAEWYPTEDPGSFKALGIIWGSILVTLGSGLMAVPIGITAAVCLSDILPFGVRQVVKPVIELLAAIPSVAYGFFALVVFAPLLQNHGGTLLTVALWILMGPVVLLAAVILSELATTKLEGARRKYGRPAATVAITLGGFWLLYVGSTHVTALEITSGVNALNASIWLAVMALPTVVSVCEDSLTAVGRDLREGSYALGSTRAETITRVVIPAAKGGILAGVLLGIMRAIGETMVVLMAAGNAIEVPKPMYNLLAPVRTLTATIAIEMAEVDHTTKGPHYRALFALAFFLLCFAFICNVVSEWSVRRTRKKLQGLK